MIATKLTAALAATALVAAAGAGIAAARPDGQESPATSPPVQPQREGSGPAVADAPAQPRPEANTTYAVEVLRPATVAASNEPGDSNPKTAVILAKLDEPLPLNFPNETPLEDVLKYIKQATETSEGRGLPFYVDPIGLNEADKTMTSPVSIDLDGVPVRRTLQLMLKQLGLVYYVEDGILVITSPEAAERGMGADRARPSRLKAEMEKAERGELGADEMKALSEKLKLLGEIRKLHDAATSVHDPRP
jgi:hypothetical protein